MGHSQGAGAFPRPRPGHAIAIQGETLFRPCPARRKALENPNEINDINEVDILLVEDNPYDAELTLRALRNKGLSNKLFTCSDGVEALDFLFGNGI